MELHLFWNGRSILFPIPFASPSLRLGQQGTRSLSPPCSSNGLRGGTCNSSWDHTQSHSGVTRVQQCSLWASLTMNLHSKLGLGSSFGRAKGWLTCQRRAFSTFWWKTQRWFPASSISFLQQISLQAISSQKEWEDSFPVCSTQRGLLYTAWYRQQRAALWAALSHHTRLLWHQATPAAHSWPETK